MQESFDDLLSRLRSDRLLFQSGEEATRQGAVLPILSQIGWNRDNIREVSPEFPVGSGRVDYCLRVGDRKVVFIEVKRTDEDLERHQEQLLDYAFRDGVEIAALTNGLSWWLYMPLLEGSWDQRKFFVIDIEQQEVGAAARHFREFLSREAIANGSALASARAIHASNEKVRIIAQTIPRAWRQLCEGPDELLLKVLADKVESLCGHRPDEEPLAEYLVTVIQSPEPTSPAPPRPGPAKPRPPRRGPVEPTWGQYTGTRPVSYSFRGQRYPVSTFKEILIGVCEALYRIHPANFSRVLTLHGRKRVYFSRDPRSMKSPQEIPASGIYAETNLSANSIMERCNELLGLFGYSRDELQVEVQDR